MLLYFVGLCPPGTKSKKLTRLYRQRFPDQKKAFEPFCIRCGEGYYQPKFSQPKCKKCPETLFSLPGSKSRDDCFFPSSYHACTKELNLCENQGQCVLSFDSKFQCKCQIGFFGWRCQHQMNPCLSGPCYNKGVCQPNGKQFTCKCLDEFEGALCEQSVSKCEFSYCQNEGKCKRLPDGDTECDCKMGFVGDRCEVKYDPCSDLECKHGKCVKFENRIICECNPGYMGRHCDRKPCDYSPCPKAMKCSNKMSKSTNKSDFLCQCRTGFTGDDCAVRINPCIHNPCQHNGVCEPIGNSNSSLDFVCKCPNYFVGRFCETLIIPDYEMHFEEAALDNYVEMAGPKSNLSAVSKDLEHAILIQDSR